MQRKYWHTHYLMIDQLSATANSHLKKNLETSLGPPWPMVISEWQHACKLEDHGLFCHVLSLYAFRYFSNPLLSRLSIMPGSIFPPWLCWLTLKGALLMYITINQLFVRAHFILKEHISFLLRLILSRCIYFITRVYGKQHKQLKTVHVNDHQCHECSVTT